MSAGEPSALEGRERKKKKPKRRVLFVDDEQNVLDGLRNRLRKHRRVWEMCFAEGPDAAIEAMKEAPFDVVVTDMRMPKMDGAALLELVQREHPGTVRIVLSGQAEVESALRAVPVAHQYLSKPCDGAVLEEAIERSCELQALLADERLRSMVGGTDGLPSLPRVYTELSEALQDPEVVIADVARIVEQDIAMSAKILKLVNSAFFGLPQRITSVDRAVSYLGTKMIQNLALTAQVFDGAAVPRISGFDLEAVHAHSFLAARIAKGLSEDKALQDDGFTAAVLHDVGKIILATRLPEEFGEIIAAARAEGRPLATVEVERLGICHAEVGGLLLGIWGLPYPVVEAVASHHDPSRVGASSFDLVGAVHVADCLAVEVAGTPENLGQDARIEPDMAYLATVGVADKLPGWSQMAAEQGRAVGM